MARSVNAYRKVLQKYLGVYNGKLLKEFEDLNDELHIAGYYRGMLHSVGIVKEALKAAKAFIEKIK
ncbi:MULTISPECIES: DUF5618 family protein [Candidatus Brocadia]|uniref:DUF5618 family protein n=1 Tax=Candidatus Brocadia TaxID=380240 RepID=UPI0021BC0679|nr:MULTISPECIES: DUF5618 family protein [Brocadia]